MVIGRERHRYPPGQLALNHTPRLLDNNFKFMALNSRYRDQPNASQQLKRAGGVVTGLSAVALLWAATGLVVDQEEPVAVLLVCMSLWGLATGVGLLRLQPWSRFSMLVFHCLLCICAVSSVVLLVVIGSTTPNKGI